MPKITTSVTQSDGTPKEFQQNEYKLAGVTLARTEYINQSTLEIRMPSGCYQDPKIERLTDRNFMAWLPVDFGDGTIDVDVASELASDAPDYSRGFIGLAYRIDDKGYFENIYLRPINSVSDDQVRRNHTIQYAAYPDFPFDQLRSQFPEKYETYADISTEQWIHMRLKVNGPRVELYLNGCKRPAFLVDDMKLGATQRGGVGIWIESGTVAHFKNFQILINN